MEKSTQRQPSDPTQTRKDVGQARARFVVVWIFIAAISTWVLAGALKSSPDTGIGQPPATAVKTPTTVAEKTQAPAATPTKVLLIGDHKVRYADMERDKVLFREANECWSSQNYSRMMEILWDLNSKGYRRAITLLGNAYLTGNGVERSYDLGRLHWKRGAMLGNVYSMQGLSDSYASNLQGYEPVESAMWSIVANAFEDPSSAFATGSTLTAQRLAKLTSSERELAMMNAKALIERIRERKRQYEAVIDESL